MTEAQRQQYRQRLRELRELAYQSAQARYLKARDTWAPPPGFLRERAA